MSGAAAGEQSRGVLKIKLRTAAGRSKATSGVETQKSCRQETHAPRAHSSDTATRRTPTERPAGEEGQRGAAHPHVGHCSPLNGDEAPPHVTAQAHYRHHAEGHTPDATDRRARFHLCKGPKAGKLRDRKERGAGGRRPGSQRLVGTGVQSGRRRRSSGVDGCGGCSAAGM